MKKPQYLSMATAVALSLLVGCNTDPGIDPRTITQGKYRNASIGLSMTFPNTWALKTDQKFGSITADLVAVGLPSDGFSPNANVIITAHSGPADMATILPMVTTEIKNQILDATAFRDTVYEIDGHEVGQIEYESTQNGYALHYLQILLINKGKDVVITFTDKAAQFASNREIQDILTTIHVE